MMPLSRMKDGVYIRTALYPGARTGYAAAQTGIPEFQSNSIYYEII